MVRKAVVIVPSEEDYKARLEAQEKAETKDVPDNAVMEMKGTYNLDKCQLSQRLSHFFCSLFLSNSAFSKDTKHLPLTKWLVNSFVQ